MYLDLQGGNGVPRRWDVLRAVLPRTLAEFDARLPLGAMLFPAAGTLGCAAPTALDVSFATGNSVPIAQRLDAAEPGGRTPTYAALVQAERLLREVAGEGPRAVILATDGGPNCNASLDGDRCVCAATVLEVGRQECREDPSLCLDDVRAVAQAEAMAARAVPTYVVGIDGDRTPALVAVLNRLARAGGRANPLSATRAYYAVQRPEDLAAAVSDIGRGLAACTFTADRRPAADARVTLSLRGAAIPQDPAHAEGWDWIGAEGASLALFGTACASLGADASPVASVRCAGP